MKEFTIPYGAKELRFSIPAANFSEYLDPNFPELPGNDREEVERSLENPIGTDHLEHMVKPTDKIAILCEDITRYAQTDIMLEALVDRLGRAGVPDDNITIVMALGSHRPMTDAEKIVKVGAKLFQRIRVLDSENKDKSKLVDAGLAPGNVRVWLDPVVHNSDFRIGVGSIEPHTAAGYTGGGKIIYPGVVGVETVSNFHLIAASEGNLTGDPDNPARLTMEAWVDTVGLDFIVNAVVTPKNEIYRVVAGHYVKAHREGVKYSREVWGIRSHNPIDIAIVSSHPADLDFWQGGKGIVNCEKVISDGGLLILATPCPEGAGPHPEYIDYMGCEDYRKLLHMAHDGSVPMEGVLPLAVGAAVARIAERINVAVISDGLTDEEIRKAKMLPFKTIEEAVQHGLDTLGTEARIAVVPMGGGSFLYRE